MTTITDPRSGVTALVKPCKVCNQPIYFGFTDKGKRCPFDVIDGQPTRTSHFVSCPEVAKFRESRAKLITAGLWEGAQ